MTAEAALILRLQLLPPNSPTRRRQNGDSTTKVKRTQHDLAYALD
jgi:hypothetical protein